MGDFSARTSAGTSALVKKAIEVMSRGEPFTSRTFLKYGTRAAVDHALSRLVKVGLIARVARGIYVRPKVNRSMPAADAVARAVARESGEKVQLGGAAAAAALQLGAKLPVGAVFETSGAARRFRVGKLEIRLKRVATRKLALAGRPAGNALAALWYLGKRQVTQETIAQVRRKLPAREYQALKEAVPFQAAWMSEAFREHERRIRRPVVGTRLRESAVASVAAARAEAAERERIRRMSALERALLALELGERLDALKRLRP